MGEDVADGKSSRPWAMHGQPPGRPAGPSNSYTLPVHPLKIEHWSIFKEGMDIIWRLALIPHFESDPWLILLKGNEGFGGFEADRLRDRILCTQRTWRG